MYGELKKARIRKIMHNRITNIYKINGSNTYCDFMTTCNINNSGSFTVVVLVVVSTISSSN